MPRTGAARRTQLKERVGGERLVVRIADPLRSLEAEAALRRLGSVERLGAGRLSPSLPIARSAVLVGRTISDVMRNAGCAVLMLAVALLIGFRPSEPLLRIVAAFALLVLFAYAFSWVSASIALLVRDPETAQSAGFIWVFPLTFASSAFVPPATMPGAVRAFADVNPITLCVNAVRDLMLGGNATGAVLGTLAWLAGLLLIFVPLAVGRYRALE
jgi:ABC-type polysaccharide/polyol phosphate export permease